LLFPALAWAYAAAAKTDPGSFGSQLVKWVSADTERRRLSAALGGK
jgi:hypothetical protein